MVAFAAAPETGVAAPRAPPAAAAAGVAAVATMPSWTARPTFDELGVVGWFKARYSDPPVRPDRTATLRNEGGGRLDKLDLWIVVVLIIGTMVLRTFRLDQPQQMHFDEVYHARTATEFLQDWRYGLSHDIYEWTHPHLAKYLMAAGIVLWGGDHVETTSDLGVPVVATAVEARRIDPVGANAPAGDTSGVRAGERLHVATGTEIRTYDLRTRALLVDHPGARRERAGHRRHGPEAGHRLRRRAPRDARSRPDRHRRGRRAAGPDRAGNGRPPGRPSDGRQRGRAGDRGLGQPADVGRWGDRDRHRVARPVRHRRPGARRQRLGGRGHQGRRDRPVSRRSQPGHHPGNERAGSPGQARVGLAGDHGRAR